MLLHLPVGLGGYLVSGDPVVIRLDGREAPAHGVLADHARVHELEQIIRPSGLGADAGQDRKSTRLNSSHLLISYAVFCLKKKK